ncbi:MAG: hypothetical protein HXY46_13905 [Syntrophaceae bacterium]|nr:hypothetical protein [Syntrophaceae bacterium]
MRHYLLFICLIFTLLLFSPNCTIKQFVLQKEHGAIDGGQNLVPNGDIEILENGEPVRWNYRGRCAVGCPGFQSDYALTMEVSGQDQAAQWETQLSSIKPHTKYVICFWYRLPQKGRIEVILFGKTLSVDQMFRYNPMHWCRYSAILDSEEMEGNCKISFLAKGGIGPFKFWIDRIELYEGESPIGQNCARLQYQYYNTAYVSPDIISPLPFAFEWTFDNGHRPQEIQYIVELPDEVEFISCALGRICKWPPDGWSITWTRRDDTSKVEIEKILMEGRPYFRVLARVASILGDEKQLTDYVVPVGVRDHWKGSLGRYSGMISMCLYVRSKVSSGSFPFYYYAKWDRGQQPRKRLNLEVITIPEAGSSKNLVLISEVQMQAGDKNPQLAEDFLRIGLNGIGHMDLRGGDSALRNKIGKFRQMGLRYFTSWVNIASYNVDDKDAKAMDLNGQRTGKGGWCLSYRGPGWVKNMNQYKKRLESGVNFLAFDDAKPSTCYCDQCKRLFAQFLRINTDLPYIDPSLFMKEGWNGDQRYKILWKDFSLWHYGRTAQAMKHELVQSLRYRGLNGRIYFGISSWLPFTHPFAAKSLTAFDFDIRQTYMNWASSSFGGSPKKVGDYLYQSQEALGIYARALAATLSPGLTYMHPACALDPYSQMKYQILEAMMAPHFAGYLMYAGKDIDLGDMKYMAEANALMVRFEEIVLKGKAIKPIEINQWSGVRIKKLGSKGLVLVSDYSTYEPIDTIVRFSSNDLDEQTLIDAESGEKIIPISGIYHVKIKAERARLLYFGAD